jgi:hypothetical protein
MSDRILIFRLGKTSAPFQSSFLMKGRWLEAELD